MAYDRNGNYLKTLIQNRSFNMEFNVLENSIIISDGRTVSLYDKQGKLENEIRISPFDSISFGTSNHLSDFSSQEVIFSCPGSDTLYFWVKAALPVKYPWITVIIKARSNSKNRFRTRSPSLIFTISFP